MSRSRGATRLTTRSPIRISPSVTDSRPASIRSAVVLPEPDGPTSTRNSPSAAASVSSRTASTASKRLVTSSYSTRATRLPLDRAREHAADEVPLEEDVEHDDRRGDDHGARGEQREVGRVPAREERQAERRRPQPLVGDHHQREQELVPGPHED